MLSVQISALNNHMQSLKHKSQTIAQMAQVMTYEICGSNHSWDKCPLQAELVNYIDNFSRR